MRAGLTDRSAGPELALVTTPTTRSSRTSRPSSYRAYVQNGENPDLVTLAETMLPKLEEHLQMAKALQAKYAEQQ